MARTGGPWASRRPAPPICSPAPSRPPPRSCSLTPCPEGCNPAPMNPGPMRSGCTSGPGADSASREPASSSSARQARASSAGSGSGRCGAGHLHLHIAAKELQRRIDQEPRCQPVAFAPILASFRLTSEREQNEAEGESKAAGSKAHARNGTEVAVLPWQHRASHEGLQGSGVVIWCVHRDASCHLRCQLSSTYHNDIILMGGSSSTALAVRLGAEGSGTGCTGSVLQGFPARRATWGYGCQGPARRHRHCMIVCSGLPGWRAW